MAMTVELPITQTSADAPRAPAARLSRFARPALGLLLPVGAALFGEAITAVRIAGVVLCLLGLTLLQK